MTKLWVSSPLFTGQVDINEHGQIYGTPRVWGRFNLQPIEDLLRWLRRFGPVEVETI